MKRTEQGNRFIYSVFCYWPRVAGLEQVVRDAIFDRLFCVVKIGIAGKDTPMVGTRAERGDWYIPLAALTPRGLNGILVTGKPACRKIHYIASCALAGQAVGAAAAESERENKELRDTDLEAVRRILRKQGVLI